MRDAVPAARPVWAELLLWSALIVALTLVAYVPALRAGFVWDDDAYVQNNETLVSLDGLRRIWLEPTSVPQYYPLVFTSFWVEHQLWWLDPAGYHGVNVLLHAASAVLLWLLLHRLAVPGAWLAAAIFALHPVEVESVAWITERKNVLSGLFYLAAFHAYWRFADAKPDPSGARPWGTYAASVLLFVGALLSKTVTGTLPAALLLARWWKHGRLARGDVLPLVPFFVLGAGMGLGTAWLETHHVGARGAEWALSFLNRCCIAGRALWFYAGKLLWPYPLCFIYPRWHVDPSVWWQVLFPVAAAAVVVALWTLRARIGRGPLAATLFFAGTLFPALGFFDVYPMRYSFVADHFQYLASIGPIVLAAALASRVASGRNAVGAVAAAALLVALGVLTWRQGSVYRDLETLWRDTIAKNNDAGIAHDNLANILLARGRAEEAVAHYREALRVKADHMEAHNNMAAALNRLKRYDEAEASARQAIRIDPIFSDAHVNLGVALAAQGKIAAAIAEYGEAIRIRPTNIEAHNNLAGLLLGQGRTQEAIDHYMEAIRVKPDFPEAHQNLGRALFQSGRLDDAAREYEAALHYRPSYANAQHGLGMVYARQGRGAQAVEALRAALRLQPNWSEAERDLAWILATHPDAAVRNGSQAVQLAEHACQQTRYQDAASLDTLAAAYAEAGRFAEAAETADKALHVAEAAGNTRLADGIRARTSVYRAGQAFREAAP